MEKYSGPIYYESDAIEFIRSRSDLSEDVISKVLDLEMDYMRSIGLVGDEQVDVEEYK